MSVRVRFAPSPTGYLHVGGLRTALYNYLFARRHNGKMILRIEDTDRTRFVENAQENLIKMLRWAGIDFDEGPDTGGEFGPYIQSERFALYSQYAQQLLDSGKAYYAFDTAEELEAMRARLQTSNTGDYRYDRNNMRNSLTLGMEKAKELISAGEAYVVRMLCPEAEEIVFNDIIRGEVKVNTRDVDDQVLIKSDGFPTYHLANVVDDYTMKITHVIRGEEWLPSTPKHCILYDSFGWERPQFAHLPLLLNKDKTKLSKRQGSVAVEDFKDKYIKEAFLNFVALLGFNPSADNEIYSMEELTQLFNLEKVNKAGAVFDVQKLDWFNFKYLQAKAPSELAQELKPIVKQKFNKDFEVEYLEKVIILVKERISFIAEVPEYCPYMFNEEFEYEEAYIQKHWKAEKSELYLELAELYRTAESFEHSFTYNLTKEFAESKALKMKEIIHPIRLMITGRSIGAGMFETMEIIGRKNCINRMKRFIESNK